LIHGTFYIVASTLMPWKLPTAGSFAGTNKEGKVGKNILPIAQQYLS